jgi:hypothetical protein
MGAVMAATVLNALQLVRSGRGAGVGRVLNAVVVAFLAMSVSGIALAVAPTSLTPTILFGGVMAVTMSAEFLFLVREGLVAHSAGSAPGTPTVAPAPRGAGAALPAAPSEP